MDSFFGPIGLMLGHRLYFPKLFGLLSSKSDECLHVFGDAIDGVVFFVLFTSRQLIKLLIRLFSLLVSLRYAWLLVGIFDDLLAHVVYVIGRVAI
mgnify:CR=1 FL=1